MKIKILTTLWILLSFSCQHEKKIKQTGIQKDKSLDTIISIDTLLNSKEREFSDYKINTDKEELLRNFKHLIKITFLNELEVSKILLEGKHSPDIEKNHKNFLGYYFMNFFERSPENIKNLFGDTEIDLISKLVDDSYLNENSLWLNGFIKSFEELKNDPEFLNKASQEKNNKKYLELIEAKYSAEVREIIDFNSYFDTDSKLFKIYSFWVRRYKEGNAEIIYEILNKLKSKLPVNHNKNLMDFQRDKIVSQISNNVFSPFDFNKETLNFLIYETKVIGKYFERFIADPSIFIPRNQDEQQSFSTYNSDLMTKINKIYSDFNRSPENIEEIFDESLINHIALLFNNNILPRDQRLYGVLKGLLLSYDEMNDDECERLKNIMMEFQYHDMREEFDKKCSNEVKNFVIKGGNFNASIQNDSDIDFGYRKRIFYLYSFWIRRYDEGNKETVYRILKKIDNRVK